MRLGSHVFDMAVRTNPTNFKKPKAQAGVHKVNKQSYQRSLV